MKRDRVREGLTYEAAAGRCRCSASTVHAARKKGRIELHSDGSLNEKSVLAWNAGRTTVNRGPRKAGQFNTDDAPARMAQAAIELTLSEGGLFPNRAAAELARDSYQARLKQLEYEEKSGRLVEADEVQRDAAAVYAMVRTRIMAVPTHVAPSLARLRTAPEVEDVLRGVLTEILEELAQTLAARA